MVFYDPFYEINVPTPTIRKRKEDYRSGKCCIKYISHKGHKAHILSGTLLKDLFFL